MFEITRILSGLTLSGLANTVRETFDDIATQAQGRWLRQHTNEGAHTDITCESIVVPQIRLDMADARDPTGRIFVRDASSPNALSGTPLDVPPDAMFVSIIAASGGGTYQLFGIRKHGVKFGDVLFIRKDPRSAANIELQDRTVALVPVNTEIHVPQDCALSYPSFFLSTSGAWLPLVYSPGVGTGNANGWAFLYTFSA